MAIHMKSTLWLAPINGHLGDFANGSSHHGFRSCDYGCVVCLPHRRARHLQRRSRRLSFGERVIWTLTERNRNPWIGYGICPHRRRHHHPRVKAAHHPVTLKGILTMVCRRQIWDRTDSKVVIVDDGRRRRRQGESLRHALTGHHHLADLTWELEDRCWLRGELWEVVGKASSAAKQ